MTQLQIDIVSDISCPWCIIGYKSLQLALGNLANEVSADIVWHPFELNPNMPPAGQDIEEHLGQKYGISKAQIQQNRETIKQRGLSVGYEFGNRGGGRIYNTFDAHRLLHWAKQDDKQTALKLALFDLYFKAAGDPSDHKQLLVTAENIGLNKELAAKILIENIYSDEVRKEQHNYHTLGISSVPAVIINNKHLISGGHPPEVFEKALCQISAELS